MVTPLPFCPAGEDVLLVKLLSVHGDAKDRVILNNADGINSKGFCFALAFARIPRSCSRWCCCRRASFFGVRLLDDFCFPDRCCLFLDDLVMFMYFRHAVSSLRVFHSYTAHPTATRKGHKYI